MALNYSERDRKFKEKINELSGNIRGYQALVADHYIGVAPSTVSRMLNLKLAVPIEDSDAHGLLKALVEKKALTTTDDVMSLLISYGFSNIPTVEWRSDEYLRRLLPAGQFDPQMRFNELKQQVTLIVTEPPAIDEAEPADEFGLALQAEPAEIEDAPLEQVVAEKTEEDQPEPSLAERYPYPPPPPPWSVESPPASEAAPQQPSEEQVQNQAEVEKTKELEQVKAQVRNIRRNRLEAEERALSHEKEAEAKLKKFSRFEKWFYGQKEKSGKVYPADYPMKEVFHHQFFSKKYNEDAKKLKQEEIDLAAKHSLLQWYKKEFGD